MIGASTRIWHEHEDWHAVIGTSARIGTYTGIWAHVGMRTSTRIHTLRSGSKDINRIHARITEHSSRGGKTDASWSLKKGVIKAKGRDRTLERTHTHTHGISIQHRLLGRTASCIVIS